MNTKLYSKTLREIYFLEHRSIYEETSEGADCILLAQEGVNWRTHIYSSSIKDEVFFT
jgi:hypothetical protein